MTRGATSAWLGLLLACGTPEAGSGDARVTSPAVETLEVFAASSLTEAFTELARSFEAAHPETRVVLTFAGSQVLRLQIAQGAEAHVFASANPAHVRALEEQGFARDGRAFARNQLVVLVPADGSSPVTSFAELPRAERLVIAAEAVPAGAYARQVLAAADARLGAGFGASVLARVVSEESNVRLARAKVELGEADAALVYRTDALGAPGCRVLPVPEGLGPPPEYRLAVVGEAPPGGGADRFVAHVISPEGQAVLARHGFGGAP